MLTNQLVTSSNSDATHINPFFRHKKLLCNYTEKEREPTVDSESHEIKLLKGKNSLHFFKKIAGSSAAEHTIHCEHLIQELLRLIIPRQPKTRMLFDSVAETAVPIGLMSKKVDGFQSYGSMNFLALASSLLSGTITGLGEICVMLLVTCEHDAKIYGNIGINNQYQTIKLDGAQAMLSMVNDEFSTKYPLTRTDIEKLPLPPQYLKKLGGNWLQGIISKNDLFTWLVSHKKSFRTEVNLTLLKFILLPDSMLKLLIDHLAPEGDKQLLFAQFRERNKQTKSAALRTNSFCDYLNSDQALKEVGVFLKHLDSFTLARGIRLASLVESYKEETLSEFNLLKMAAKKTHPSYELSFRVGAATLLLFLSVLITLLMKYDTNDHWIRKTF